MSNEPKGSKQSSGKVKHASSMPGNRVENLSGMPTVHSGGGKGGDLVGMSTRKKSTTQCKVSSNA